MTSESCYLLATQTHIDQRPPPPRRSSASWPTCSHGSGLNFICLFSDNAEPAAGWTQLPFIPRIPLGSGLAGSRRRGNVQPTLLLVQITCRAHRRTSAAFEYGRVWPLSFYCRSGHTSRFCLSSKTDNQQTDDGSQDIYPEKKLIVTY